MNRSEWKLQRQRAPRGAKTTSIDGSRSSVVANSHSKAHSHKSSWRPIVANDPPKPSTNHYAVLSSKPVNVPDETLETPDETLDASDETNTTITTPSDNGITKIIEPIVVDDRALIVLDINGVLQFRVFNSNTSELLITKHTIPDTVARHIVGPRTIYPRPHIADLWRFLFEYYDVAIATSMNKANAETSIAILMTPEQRKRIIFVATECITKTRSTLVSSHYRRVLFLDDDAHKMRENDRNDYYLVPSYDPSDGDADNVVSTLIKVIPSLVGLW